MKIIFRFTLICAIVNILGCATVSNGKYQRAKMLPKGKIEIGGAAEVVPNFYLKLSEDPDTILVDTSNGRTDPFTLAGVAVAEALSSTFDFDPFHQEANTNIYIFAKYGLAKNYEIQLATGFFFPLASIRLKRSFINIPNHNFYSAMFIEYGVSNQSENTKKLNYGILKESSFSGRSISTGLLYEKNISEKLLFIHNLSYSLIFWNSQDEYILNNKKIMNREIKENGHLGSSSLSIRFLISKKAHIHLQFGYDYLFIDKKDIGAPKLGVSFGLIGN